LVLRRGSDLTFNREVGQKRGDLGLTHLRRMPLAME